MGEAKRRVLIVDDDITTCRALRNIFRKHGWEIVTARTIAEGLASLGPPPTCAVIDLLLPDGPGERIVRAIIQAELLTCIVVCTGVADDERLRRVETYGRVTLLRKPVRADDVFAACNT